MTCYLYGLYNRCCLVICHRYSVDLGGADDVGFRVPVSRRGDKMESVDEDNSDEDLSDDDEDECSQKHLARKYGDLGGELLVLEILRGADTSLGVQLAGNKDLNRMSVFVCGIRPNGDAGRDGRLRLGDELLEVDGQALYGRSHVNASAIIKSCKSDVIKVIVHRDDENIDSMAVRPRVPRKSSASKQGSRDHTPEGSRPGSRRGSYADINNDSRKASLISLPAPAPHEEIFHITLTKGDQGLGFAIMEGSFTDEPGIYVKHVTPAGPAAVEGTLHPGDRLLSVDDHEIADVQYDEALDRLRAVKGECHLTVGRVVLWSSSGSASYPTTSQPTEGNKRTSVPNIITSTVKIEDHVAKERQRRKSSSGLESVPSFNNVDAKTSDSFLAPPSPNGVQCGPPSPPTDAVDNVPQGDPAECPVRPGRETEIHLNKPEGVGLGISVVGGADSSLGAIIVHDIYEAGAASKDSRLSVGDQLLSINESDLRSVPLVQALNALQVPPGKVILWVFRGERPMRPEDLYPQPISVDLIKKPGKGLGFSIAGRSGGALGVFISDVVRGSPADCDGRLRPGDQVLKVNSQDVREASQDRVAAMLKSANGPVNLTVGRITMTNDATSRRNSNPQIDKKRKGKSPARGGI